MRLGKIYKIFCSPQRSQLSQTMENFEIVQVTESLGIRFNEERELFEVLHLGANIRYEFFKSRILAIGYARELELLIPKGGDVVPLVGDPDIQERLFLSYWYNHHAQRRFALAIAARYKQEQSRLFPEDDLPKKCTPETKPEIDQGQFDIPF